MLPRSFIVLLWVQVLAAGCRNGSDATPPFEPPVLTPAPALMPPPDGAPSATEGVLRDGVSEGVRRDGVSEAVLRDRLEQQLRVLGQEGYYGVDMMGNKVGSGQYWFRPVKDGEPGAYVYGFAMKMAVSGGGNANLLTVDEQRFYAKDFPYPLVETRFATTAKGFVDLRVGVPTGAGRMRITRQLDGKPEPDREVAGSLDDLVGQLRMSPLELRDSEIGLKSRVALWSWEREADEFATVVFESIETRQRAGVSERVGVFAITYEANGTTGKTRIADDGTMLEMTLGPALMLKLEERAVAEGGIVGLDILGTAVASPTKLGRPDPIDALRLEVSGPSELRLPGSRARTVERLAGDRDRARWSITFRRGPGDQVTAPERALALVGDATLDIANPAIIARATALTAGLTSPSDKVSAVSDWVYRTLDKKLATHLPTASTVLEKKVGDCTEHTWLTVALLRAAGIPARPLYGIAYAGDGEAVFAYHAWVEVALPEGAIGKERWLAIDPTWGEAEADATHFVLGTTLGEVAASIGGLVIEKATILSLP